MAKETGSKCYHQTLLFCTIILQKKRSLKIFKIENFNRQKTEKIALILTK